MGQIVSCVYCKRNGSTYSSVNRSARPESITRSIRRQLSRSDKNNLTKTRNKPLNKNLHKQSVKGSFNNWSKDHLTKERTSFWDTAPAYEGREEVWLTLKAVVDEIHKSPPNYELAQAMIDGAAISLPYGNLNVCYDELGTLYRIPAWVVALPKVVNKNFNDSFKILKSPSNQKNKIQEEKTKSFRKNVSIKSNCSKSEGKNGKLKNYKFRLMNYEADNTDILLKNVSIDDTVKDVKLLFWEALKEKENKNEDYISQVKENVDDEVISKNQTWFCAGKLLNDACKMTECGINDSFVIQVHMRL